MNIDNENESFGCRLRKTKDRQKDTYLVSRRQRDEATFWVDVTEDIPDATLRKIDKLRNYYSEYIFGFLSENISLH